MAIVPDDRTSPHANRGHPSGRRPWLRTLIVAVLGLVLLSASELALSRVMNSEQPWATVSCLDSSCTYPMSMQPSMSQSMTPSTSSMGTQSSNSTQPVSGGQVAQRHQATPTLPAVRQPSAPGRLLHAVRRALRRF